MDGVNNSSGLCKTHAMADAISATNPTGVDKPDLGAVLLALLGEHLSVDVGMEGKEGLTITS